MHTLFDPCVCAYRDPEQLDPIPEFVGRLEIFRGERGNALDVDRGGIDLGAERKARRNRQLLRGVVAFDIEGRIGFRIAQALRVLQTLRKCELLALHAGEDVIAGAVENSIDARERICPPFPHATSSQSEWPHPAAASKFRATPFFSASSASLHSVTREQGLVGGDDGLAGGKRRRDSALRRIVGATHQLDEDIDLRVNGKSLRIGDPADFAQRSMPRFLAFFDRAVTAMTSIGRPVQRQ